MASISDIEKDYIERLLRRGLLTKESLDVLGSKSLFDGLIRKEIVSAQDVTEYFESRFLTAAKCSSCGRKRLVGVLDYKGAVCSACRGPLKPLESRETLRDLEIPAESEGHLVGKTFARHYVEKLVGGGTNAAVYRARHTGLNRLAALKILRPNFARRHVSYIERFLKEARIVAQMKHPNIVEVYDVGEDQGLYYIAMEYVTGGSLADRLKNLGNLWEEEALKVALDVAAALVSAHSLGLVHLDIKPDNIMLADAGRGKLSDFGLAGEMELAGLPAGDKIRGTAPYMSPEQARNESLDERSDIYSLGMTLFRMLSGKLPYAGSSSEVRKQQASKSRVPRVRAMMPEISRETDALVWKMVRKNRLARYQSAVAVCDDIKLILKGKAPLALGERLERLKRTKKRSGKKGEPKKKARMASASAPAPRKKPLKDYTFSMGIIVLSISTILLILILCYALGLFKSG